MDNDELFCPRCKGCNIVTGQKGFSIGKAVAGGALLGPLGLLAGTHKSKDIRFTCLDCGNTFSVDELIESKARIRRADRMIADMKTGKGETEGGKSDNIFAYCIIGIAVIFFLAMVILLASLP